MVERSKKFTAFLLVCCSLPLNASAQGAYDLLRDRQCEESSNLYAGFYGPAAFDIIDAMKATKKDSPERRDALLRVANQLDLVADAQYEKIMRRKDLISTQKSYLVTIDSTVKSYVIPTVVKDVLSNNPRTESTIKRQFYICCANDCLLENK